MRLYKHTLLWLLFVLTLAACQDDYLTDGGVHSAETELTVYECLSQNKYHLFDSLVLLIDHLELEEQINNSGTFFAPTDYSIERYLEVKTDTLVDRTGNVDTLYTFSDMLDEITTADLLQYAFAEDITLDNASVPGDELTTLAETQVTVKKELTTDDQYYVYSSSPVYFLYYCKPGMEDERCQTTGVLTQNGQGAILHTLNYEHVFGLFTEEDEETN